MEPPGRSNTAPSTRKLKNLPCSLTTNSHQNRLVFWPKKNVNFKLIYRFSIQLSLQEELVLVSCVRRMSDSIDKRFCFDLQVDSKPGIVYTFQALSESDRKSWMDIMDGKEPVSVICIYIGTCIEYFLLSPRYRKERKPLELYFKL